MHIKLALNFFGMEMILCSFVIFTSSKRKLSAVIHISMAFCLWTFADGIASDEVSNFGHAICL